MENSVNESFIPSGFHGGNKSLSYEDRSKSFLSLTRVERSIKDDENFDQWSNRSIRKSVSCGDWGKNPLTFTQTQNYDELQMLMNNNGGLDRSRHGGDIGKSLSCGNRRSPTSFTTIQNLNEPFVDQSGVKDQNGNIKKSINYGDKSINPFPLTTTRNLDESCMEKKDEDSTWNIGKSLSFRDQTKSLLPLTTTQSLDEPGIDQAVKVSHLSIRKSLSCGGQCESPVLFTPTQNLAEPCIDQVANDSHKNIKKSLSCGSRNKSPVTFVPILNAEKPPIDKADKHTKLGKSLSYGGRVRSPLSFPTTKHKEEPHTDQAAKDSNNNNTLGVNLYKKEQLCRAKSDGILSLKKKYKNKALFLSPQDWKTSLEDITLEPMINFYSERMRKRRTGLSTCSLTSSYRKSRSSLRDRTGGYDSPELANENSYDSPSEAPIGRANGSQSIRRGSDKNADRIVINVGGTRHETFKSTLRIYPDTRLGWLSIEGNDTNDAYDTVLHEYFFDRHPTAFNQIINFYRTGKLHAPADICGPLFEEELQFWGLDEKTMEPCCWPKYTEHRDAQENLKVFDSPLLNPQDDDDLPELPVVRIANSAVLKENKTFTSRIMKYLRPSFFNSMKWISMKRNVWLVMEGRSEKRPMLAKACSLISLSFIVLSVLSLFFHSMLLVLGLEENHITFSYLLMTLDYLTFIWMATELILRFISCPNRLSFLFSSLTVVDILVLITYSMQFEYGSQYHQLQEDFSTNGSRFIVDSRQKNIEMFSIVRLFRLMRFFRLTIGLQIFKHTIIASSKELLLLMLLLLIPVAFFATVVYFFERETELTKFKTIPESIWWAIITITTVGYGDMTPQSSTGKFFGGICAVFSVLILALPVSIIGNNFSLFYNYAQARSKLPKRPKIALVGAANFLVAETSQHSLSPDITDSEGEGGEGGEGDGVNDNDNHKGVPKINFGSDPDFTANIASKRFRRERLSLFAHAPTRQSTRRSKSVGNSASGKVRARQRNGHVVKPTTPSSDDDASDASSEKLEVFKPVGNRQENMRNSCDNAAFEDGNENKIRVEIATEEKETRDQKVNITMATKNSGKESPCLDSGFKINLPEPIIETVLTDKDGLGSQKPHQLTNGLTPHHPVVLPDPNFMNNKNINNYSKFSTPPVLRKINVEGHDTLPVNGMIQELDYSGLGERRKLSNNHLYVPDDIC